MKAAADHSLWLLLMLTLTSTSRASDDWQYWNQLAFKHEFNDRLSLDIASEQKWRDDASDFYLYNGFIIPTVRLTKNVSLGAGYRCERRQEDNSWTTENRLFVPLTLKWAVQDWTIQLRNQLEYRDLENDQDRWRFRERIMLGHPVHLGGLTVTPFVSEELFYDVTVEQTEQNRVAVGLSIPRGEHMTFAVFYMNKADRDDHWSTANILGTEVAFKF
jgi:hypothetical protein